MSEVDICNDALAVFGKAIINNLLDPEPAARRCNQFYARTLRELQARYDWEHNLTVKDIAAQTEASTVPGFRYAHKLPSDYLRFSGLTTTDTSITNMLGVTFSPVTSEDDVSYAANLRTLVRQTPVPMRIADGYIHTNFTPIRFVYHRYKTDIGTLPELFRTALVMQLAAKLVFPMTRDTKLTADVRKEASDAVMFAQDEEDNDELNEAPQGSSFEDARA